MWYGNIKIEIEDWGDHFRVIDVVESLELFRCNTYEEALEKLSRMEKDEE